MEKIEKNNLCATQVNEHNVNIENTNPNLVIVHHEEIILSSNNESKASETTQTVNKSFKQNLNNKLIYRKTKALNQLIALQHESQVRQKTARSQPWSPVIRIGKRKLLVDKHTVISALQIKEQLLFTKNIVSPNEFAPFTKNGMKRLRNGIPRMFAYPTHRSMSAKLVKLYTRNCTALKQPDVETLTDMKLEPLIQTKKTKFENTNKVETVKYNNKKLNKTVEPKKVKVISDEVIVIPEDGEILTAKTGNEEHLKVDEIVIPENCEILTLKEEEIIIPEDGEILIIQTEEEDMKVEETVNLEDGEILTLKADDEHIEVEEIANKETIVTPEDGEILMLKTEDKEHMIIIQKVGNEISYTRKKLEQLMDSAGENQMLTFCTPHLSDDNNSLIIVQNEDGLITT